MVRKYILGEYLRRIPVAGRSKDVGLWPPDFWNCRFEFRWQYGCQSLVSVVYCQVEDSATGRSLVQGSSTERGVSECDQVQQ